MVDVIDMMACYRGTRDAVSGSGVTVLAHDCFGRDGDIAGAAWCGVVLW